MVKHATFPEHRVYETTLGGRKLKVELGKMAGLANGAALVSFGDTSVLTCVTMAKAPRDGIDFFPLSVDFEEKLYSVGRIPGSFMRREGRPGEKGILTARVIDRPIRPMFPDGYRNDVQIVATAVSVDPDNAPDIPGMIGASAALCVSDIPFEGPIAGVRVGLIDGQYIVNPTIDQFKVSRLNLAVAGTTDAILMVEAGCKEISEQEMLDAIFFAHENIKKICEFISGIQAEIGKPKMEVPKYNPPEELVKEIEEFGAEKLKAALMDANKLQREENVDRVKKEIAEVLVEWDDHNNQINIKKHGISFETAAMVFADEERIEYYDKLHSIDEDRYVVLGCVQGILYVVYTMRDEAARIISARMANSTERRIYYGE